MLIYSVQISLNGWALNDLMYLPIWQCLNILKGISNILVQNLFRESRRVALITGDASMMIDSYHQEIVGERVTGNLTKSKTLVDEAMKYLTSKGLEKSSLAVEILVAEADYNSSKGNFREAIENAERALFYLKDNKAVPHTLHSVQVCLAGILARTTYVRRAKELVQKNRDISHDFRLPQWLVNMNLMIWGYISIKEKDDLAIHQWLEETQIEKETTIDTANESIFGIYAWILFE